MIICDEIATENLTSPYGLYYTENDNSAPYGERMVPMITDAASFGQTLRNRRKKLGYTQAFLSEFSGFSVSFISDLENGKSTAELGKALRLANLLGLDCTLTPRGTS